MENDFPLRINKYLALKNYSTRRGADDLIKDKKVLINGKIAKLGDKVEKDDVVTLKGTNDTKFFYYAYYKPTDVLTIGNTSEGKRIEDVAKFPEKVFPIGRLDKDSEGLLIMTNDGRLTDRLLNPDNSHEKEYSVTVDKEITHDMLVKMSLGINIGGYKTKKTKIRRKDKHTFEIILTEGKNRQIRRMCGALGFGVKKLKRTRMMNVLLGKIKPNQFRNIEGVELKKFLSSLNLS
jgi:23S rRNA pseudouridine2604 synthase